MTTRYDAPPRVALLIETARGFGRNLLCGISRYAQHNGPWRFHVTAGDWEQAAPKIKQWGVNGIIGRIANERVAEAVLDVGVPVVAIGLSDDQLKASHPLSKLPEVSPIEEHVVRLAVEHLQDRYLKHFAFVGLDDRSWSKRREVLFQRQVARLGAPVYVYQTPRSRRDRVWDREQFIMADWLRALPKPLGLFACNDDRGREVLEACHLADATVPEDIAVLGVDDDEVFCGLAYPPLSSVVLNADAAGYRAAELLAEQMNGGARRRQHIIVEAPRVFAPIDGRARDRGPGRGRRAGVHSRRAGDRRLGRPRRGKGRRIASDVGEALPYSHWAIDSRGNPDDSFGTGQAAFD